MKRKTARITVIRAAFISRRAGRYTIFLRIVCMDKLVPKATPPSRLRRQPSF